MIKINRLFCLSIFCSGLYAANAGAQPDVRELVTNFWMAGDEAAQNEAAEALLAHSSEPLSLFQNLQEGPNYDAAAPVGVVSGERITDDGTRFPYAFLIPENYDSAKSYPVEFMLHGGVGRPEWEPGETLWRRGYDSLMREDRIIVVPAAWRDAFWWQGSQADNITELLRLLKQQYNVDDNRVSMSGVSDGGTGTYFFAFKQPTHWASFLPFIGHPGVLRNSNSGGGYRLYFENLLNKPLYIVNGEEDRLYPAESVQPFINVLVETEIQHSFRIIEGGGHNTNWLPEETPAIEAFKSANPRDPFPDQINWVADRTDRYNRNHWLLVNKRSKRGAPAIIEASRTGNHFTIDADGAELITLLLSPEEVDFTANIKVTANDEIVFDGKVEPLADTVIEWAKRDLDRSLLVAAELQVAIDGS
ncbi:MAG: hypothetical protein AB8B95_02965 [Pseudohongiellaceae bacterium]